MSGTLPCTCIPVLLCSTDRLCCTVPTCSLFEALYAVLYAARSDMADISPKQSLPMIQMRAVLCFVQKKNAYYPILKSYFYTPDGLMYEKNITCFFSFRCFSCVSVFQLLAPQPVHTKGRQSSTREVGPRFFAGVLSSICNVASF